MCVCVRERERKRLNAKYVYMKIFIRINGSKKLVYTYSTTSLCLGYETKISFERSTAALNSEFSFSLTRCLTKTKEPSLKYNLFITGEWGE